MCLTGRQAMHGRGLNHLPVKETVKIRHQAATCPKTGRECAEENTNEVVV